MPRGTPSYERLKESVNDLRAANRKLLNNTVEQDLTIAELRRENQELRDQIALIDPDHLRQQLDVKQRELDRCMADIKRLEEDNARVEALRSQLSSLSAKMASLEEAYDGAMKKHDDDREVWRMRASGLEDRLRKMEDEHSDLMSQERYAQTVIRKALLDAVAAASGRRNTN